jgi:hypothetical protein
VRTFATISDGATIRIFENIRCLRKLAVLRSKRGEQASRFAENLPLLEQNRIVKPEFRLGKDRHDLAHRTRCRNPA